MKFKSLFLTTILSLSLTACGGSEVGDLSIIDLNMASLGSKNVWEDKKFHQWLEEKRITEDELAELKALEESCYQNYAKDISCMKTINQVFDLNSEEVDLASTMQVYSVLAGELAKNINEGKISLAELIYYALSSRKSSDEIMQDAVLHSWMENQHLNENEIASFKALLEECHSIRASDAVCKHPIKELLENGHLAK